MPWGRRPLVAALVWALWVMGPPAYAQEDGEVVLVTDVSDAEADLPRSYVRGGIPEVPSPEAPLAEAAPSAPSPQRASTPTPKAAKAAVKQGKALLARLREATAEYGTALFDGDAVEAVAQQRGLAANHLASAVAEAKRGAKSDPALFDPLAAQLGALQADFKQLLEPLRLQNALHAELMGRTQDLLTHLPATRPHRAMRAYVKQRLKRLKPSSHANLLEMQSLQRTTRAGWWLGATTKELRFMGILTAAMWAAQVIAQLALRWARVRTPQGLAVYILCAVLCGVVAIGVITHGLGPYLTWGHRGAQAVALAVLAGGLGFFQAQVETAARPYLSPRRRKPPN